MFTVSDAAKQEILNHLDDENRYLRIFVQGGGCSGFKYGFNLEECVSDDDIQIPLNEFSILVDTFSLQYLQNASIDFEEDLSGKNFTIKNPNAQTTCGCGSSFSV